MEDPGVMPNPTVGKLNQGCQLARESRADLILAVGGGSVCDYAKAVSVSDYCKEDPWEKYFVRRSRWTTPPFPWAVCLPWLAPGQR